MRGGFKPMGNKYRRETYAKIISSGYPVHVAYRVRNWRPSRVKSFLKLNPYKSSIGKGREVNKIDKERNPETEDTREKE